MLKIFKLHERARTSYSSEQEPTREVHHCCYKLGTKSQRGVVTHNKNVARMGYICR